MITIKRLLWHVLIFGAGLFSGVLVSQCLVVLYARESGSFGGEVFTLWALPLLVAVSFSLGFDVHGIYVKSCRGDAETEQDNE